MVELIAERQSAKENKDDSANNPVVSPSVSAPQVPVVAPQDPGSAPGPSDASLEPLASTSGLQQPPQHSAYFNIITGRPNGRPVENNCRLVRRIFDYWATRQIPKIDRNY